MRKPQYIAAAITALLIVVTYWGCPVRPPDLEEAIQQSPLEATGLQSLVRAARADLNPAQMATLSTLDERLESQEDPDQRRDLLEQLAGEWYRAGHPAVSGIYATEIAELEETADAWAIAGTTFTLCLRQEGNDDKTRQFCASQAERSYQSAISLDPTNPEHRINLAVTYTDAPPSDNPMKGILQLRELEKDFPEEPRVYLTLARLAMQTGQRERAAERLLQAVELAPTDPDAVCPLAKVLEELGRSEESLTFAARCTELLRKR